jgi:hypothetical protein
MTAIRAALTGGLLPERFEARIVSVHERAVNVLLGDGRLVGLLARAEDMTAMSVQVRRLPPGAKKGMVVTGVSRIITADGWLLVDCADTPLWEGRLSPTARFPSRATELEDIALSLERALRAHGVRGGFLGLIDAFDDNQFARRGRNLLGGSEGLAGIVGLGPGFTPSGDDFLSGLLLGSEMTGTPFPPEQRAAIEGALARTTPGGYTLIWLALRGSYPAYLLRLAEDLVAAAGHPGTVDQSGKALRCESAGVDGPYRSDQARSEERTLAEAVRRAASFGETSGTDGMVGLLWHLRARSAACDAPAGRRDP